MPFLSVIGHALSSIGSIIKQNATSQTRSFLTILIAMTRSDIPRSPQGTLSSGVDRSGHFSPKASDFTVAVRGYYGSVAALQPLANDVVPLSTTDVSILEQSIPPIHCTEIMPLLRPALPCLLVDRPLKLSSAGDWLVFAYLDMKNDKAFAIEYIGPVLNLPPRSMTNASSLFPDIGTILDQMQSVVDSYSREQLKSKLKLLCQHLNSGDDGSIGRHRGLSAIFPLMRFQEGQDWAVRVNLTIGMSGEETHVLIQ